MLQIKKLRSDHVIDFAAEELKKYLRMMLPEGGDVYMVCESAARKPHDLKEALASGAVTRGELQRAARHLLRTMMKTPAFRRLREETTCD